MCMFCHCKETKYSTTTHVVTFQNCVIVVKNVPFAAAVVSGNKMPVVISALTPSVKICSAFVCVADGIDVSPKSASVLL